MSYRRRTMPQRNHKRVRANFNRAIKKLGGKPRTRRVRPLPPPSSFGDALVRGIGTRPPPPQTSPINPFVNPPYSGKNSFIPAQTRRRGFRDEQGNVVEENEKEVDTSKSIIHWNEDGSMKEE